MDYQPPVATNVQMGFYDFVANMHAPSPSMLITTKHPTYNVPECYATILERFRCHLTEDQGLVWSGLAAKSPIQWEPSTTVIKVNFIYNRASILLLAIPTLYTILTIGLNEELSHPISICKSQHNLVFLLNFQKT